MDRASQGIRKRIGRNCSRFAAYSTFAMLVACGGSGDGVSIGTGQDPDPVIVDFPIAYVRAPIPVDANGDLVQRDLREQITFDVGADLYFRDRASPSSEAINITGDLTQGLAAIRDVEMDFDGSRILFAMRFPFDPNVAEEDLPTWNIWEYTFETDELRRVIASDLSAEIGHDIGAKYLPDGRILFSSTRQTRAQAVLLDEGKPAFPAMDEDRNEFAFNLQVMNADGSGIEQVSYNQSHDLDPSVASDGRVIFARWDNAALNNAVNLYRMNPDGSELELLYGNESHDTGTNGSTIQFMQPRELEDGRILSLIRPFSGTASGGDLVVIDTPQYLENTQPTSVNIGVLTGPAQEVATVNDVSTEAGVPSPGGRYSFAYPILDGTGRVLVSWSQCRIVETLPDGSQNVLPCTPERLADPQTFEVAPPLYGIWIYDPRDDTQLPVVPGEEGFMFTEVVAADPRATPPVVLDGLNNYPDDPTLADAAEAVISIRSVYDFDGAAAADIYAMADPAQTLASERPARFLRVEKAVSIPDDDLVDLDNTDFGVSPVQGMKEIVAYAMVEPDGSVMTRVPANVALAVSVVDANGKRITARHQNWIQLRPGQLLECNGCHVANSGLSHGRYEAFDSAYPGAQVAGVEFPNTDPQWFAGDIGDTMAEIRARITCATNGCSSLEPSLNVMYRDVWTNPNVRQPDPDIDYLYSDLTTTAPATLACQQDWQSQCRSVINYESIIHPLWSQPRPVFDDMGNPVLDGNGVQVDNNCVNCHSPIDPADGSVRVPAGQLELQDGQSPDVPEHFHAYRELLVTDNLQILDNGALIDELQQVGTDADGNPIFAPIPVSPPARSAGALASSEFFDRFEDSQDLHFDMLSGTERRLIAEWLDVGAQYYNNPFDVPQN